MPTRGERLLAAELIGTEAIVTARQLADKNVPAPHQYLAGLVAYGMLSGLALVGEPQADFAAALGGLVLLTALVSFPELFTWLAESAGGTFPTSAPTSSGSSGTGGILGFLGVGRPGVLFPGGPPVAQIPALGSWLCQHSPSVFKPLFGCK